MKRFQFRLQRVQDWREEQLAVEETKLEQLHAGLRVLDARRLALDREQSASDRAVVLSKTVTSEELARLDGFRRYAKAQRILIAGRRAQVEREIEGQRNRLMEARRNLELLRRLRDKRLAAWKVEFDREIEQQAAEAHLSRAHTTMEETPRFAHE